MTEPTPEDQVDEITPSPSVSASQGSAETAGVREVSLEERLREVELQAAEHHDAWLRAKADADNVRKRAQADIAAAHKYGVERFSGDLLGVKDSLEAALANGDASVEALRSGVELTLKLINAAFEKVQIAELNPMGEKFDPHRHQAISLVESEQPANMVLQVLQKGYLLADRVIRPALVVVSKAREKTVESGWE
jgi:molecular chaperone GrpE